MSSHVWLILTRASRENLAHGPPMAALGVQKSLIDQGFWWTHLVCLQVWCLGTIRRVMSTSLKNLTLSQSVRHQERNREEVSIIFFPKSHETSLKSSRFCQVPWDSDVIFKYLYCTLLATVYKMFWLKGYIDEWCQVEWFTACQWSLTIGLHPSKFQSIRLLH